MLIQYKWYSNSLVQWLVELGAKVKLNIKSNAKWVLIVSVLFSSQIVKAECVILLHGLARTDASLNKMEKHLQKQGYSTVNYHYPSRRDDINKLATQAVSKALSLCPTVTKIHFVTHSMGGILVRQYLSQHDIKNLGRVVMLGPPNQGSELVDVFAKAPGFKLINGPAGMQLGTGKQAVPKQLGRANFELGVIAGNKSLNPMLSYILPKPNDGKVSVENTKLEGMADHISVSATHTLMMNNVEVMGQVVYFLRNGRFLPSR